MTSGDEVRILRLIRPPLFVTARDSNNSFLLVLLLKSI